MITEFMNQYNIMIMTAIMIMCSIALIVGACYHSTTNNIIRGLENRVKMRDDRIEELLEQVQNDDIENICVGNIRKIGGEWSIITKLQQIYGDDWETVRELKFTCEKADMSDYTNGF